MNMYYMLLDVIAGPTLEEAIATLVYCAFIIALIIAALVLIFKCINKKMMKMIKNNYV